MTVHTLAILRALHEATNARERADEHELVHDLMRELGVAPDPEADHRILGVAS